ncbi:hypothetical protein F-LCD7_0265 [Faustovirus]|nr:hypothetical protein F-LCD7_0265 [Faustovirus]SMH63526.1 Hypothetical protein FSTVLC9_44 [Faustovirus]
MSSITITTNTEVIAPIAKVTNFVKTIGFYLADALEIDYTYEGDYVIFKVKSMASRISSSANRVLKMLGFSSFLNFGESLITRCRFTESENEDLTYKYYKYTYVDIHVDREAEIEEVEDEEADEIIDLLLVTTNIVMKVERYVPGLQFMTAIKLQTDCPNAPEIACKLSHFRGISESLNNDFIAAIKCLEHANKCMRPVQTY